VGWILVVYHQVGDGPALWGDPAPCAKPAHVLAAKHQIVKREMPGRMLHFLSIKYIHLTQIRTD
jgi:hypothetical protein